MRKLVVILGVPIDNLDMEEALDRLEAFVATGRATGKVHQVATVNADFVVKTLHDPELRYLLQEADMATADGMPLVWGARRLGVPLQGRVTGADLVPALAERAAQRGYSIYFLGAAPGVAAAAAADLQERYPALKVAGVCSPPYRSVLEMDPSLIAEIKATRPDILLVAFGNPKQEKWIGMYGRELGVPVMIGVGGTLDFIAGKTRRAPVWMQQMGLEWLYRLLQEPGRLWRRYVADLVSFSTFFLRQWWIMRRGQAPAPLLPTTDVIVVEETAIISVKGRLDISNADTLTEKGQEALAETPFVVVDLGQASFLDSSAIGALVALAKQARDANGKLWLASVPDPISEALTMLRLDRFFDVCADVDAGLAARRRRADAQGTTVQVAGRWQVVRTPRRMDAATAPAVTETCLQILAKDAYVVLDFSDTVFLASAGLAALAHLNRQAQAHQGELRVAGCSKDVLRVIELVRFDKILTLYRDVAVATRQSAKPIAINS